MIPRRRNASYRNDSYSWFAFLSRDDVWTSQFKQDYKLAIKRNLDIALLDECIRMLAARTELALEFHDHNLTGKWAGYRGMPSIKPSFQLSFLLFFC